MNAKRFFFLAMMALSTTTVWSYDFSSVAPSGQTLYYNIVDGHVEVVRPGTTSSYNNYITGDLVIPDSVTYNDTLYAVTVLAPVGSHGTFEGCIGLTSVIIPESITTIGNYAFFNCTSLTTVIIPDNVSIIGSYAFFSVRHIEYNGNASGSRWGAISMNGVTDGDFVFSDSTKHYLISYIGSGIDVIIPSIVDTIGDQAFRGCNNLTSITIPDSITYIGAQTFYGCDNLTSVSIGSGVRFIGNYAFSHCNSLTTITIPDGVISVGTAAFRDCVGLTSVTIGNGVSSIGNDTFFGCSGLSTITIGNSVNSIGFDAFFNCSNLTTVTIPDGVTSIGAAFSGCNNLTSVTIGSGVTSIDSYAFYNCSNLTVMWMKPATPPALGNTSSICDNTIDLFVPRGSYTAYTNAGANYTRHRIYCDTVFVNVNINDTARGYVIGSDSTYANPVQCTITAIPNYGYHFARWDNNSTDSIRIVSGIMHDPVLTAYFDYNQYSITLLADSSIHGTVSGAGAYDYLSESTITATANYGYHFSHWQDGDTNNPRTITLTQDTQFIAYYGKNTYTLTFQSDNTDFGIVNTTSVSGEYLDSTMLIYTTPIPHYHFTHWNDGNTENPRRFIFTGDETNTASFGIDTHHVSVQIDDIAHGTAQGGGKFVYGTATTVWATPYSGYQFSHWSDGSTYNPYTFAVLEDRNLVAFFVADGEPWQDTVVLYDTAYVVLHDTTYINVTVHDTTIVTDTLVQIEYVNVYVHDTGTIVIIDTLLIDNYIHDTVISTEYIPVHDTAIVTDTVIQIEYVNVYITDTGTVLIIDTVFVNNYIYDTVTLTEYIPVHDTTYIDVPYPVHDTTFVPVHDTTYIDVPYPVHDTTVVYDTTVVDNYIYDTTVVVDTLWLTLYDTVWMYDTIIIHDTIVVGVDDVETVNAKVYTSNGQIVVEGADGNQVTLYDVTGRVLATKQDHYTPLRFDAPVSGTYLLKIGNYPARRVVVIR